MNEFKNIQKRGKLPAIIFLIIGIIFILRAIEIQIVKHRKFAEYADSQQKSSMVLKSKRGSIFDCNGKLLAYDLEVKSYSVNPKYMKDRSSEAQKLSKITNKSRSYWLNQFEKYPGFLYVARRVDQKDQARFEQSGISTLKSRAETVRIYPFKDLACEVIGRTDTDNIGVSGLEKQYDDLLSGTDGRSIFLRDAYGRVVTDWEHTMVEPADGSDLYLTLDLDFQQIVEKELRGMLDSSGASYGSALFMDLETGGIAASACAENGDVTFQRCRSIVDRNEPGSTAKLIPLSAVFQAKIFEPDDIINVEGGRFRIGRHTVRDDHPYDSLRCDEIGIYSSNIGVSKMGLSAGSDLIYRTLVRFGFSEKTGIDFPGEVSGLVYKPEKWTEHFLANVCFGYGISVTGLQIARAYGAVANGGELLRPFLGYKMAAPDGKTEILNSRKTVRKVLDKNTCEALNDIFRAVVLEGTATKARNELCPIAGKTGTALRTRKDGRGYDPKRSLASFVGYFPADEPRYVGIIIFDEPEISIYGGEVSAPVFRNIAERFVSLPRNNGMVKGSEKIDSIDENFVMDTKRTAEVQVAYASAENVFSDNVSSSKLPDFRGKTIRDAYRIASNFGLDCEISGGEIVVYQDPVPGTNMEYVKELHLIGK